MRYKITAVVEQDKEYSNADQIKELSSDIQMRIADYNCFRIIEDVKVEEYKPDMREKVEEYIVELNEEIDRCEEIYKGILSGFYDLKRILTIKSRIETLTQVRDDLESRLEELV